MYRFGFVFSWQIAIEMLYSVFRFRVGDGLQPVARPA